jgi:adenine-specific DNA-methyltransferase
MKKYTNKYGQFFTEREMCESILKTINNIKKISGLALEPSFGSGNFIEELSKYDIDIDAIEIDKKHFNAYSNPGVNLINIDFLDFETEKKYDFIIGNPPYIELCYSFYTKKQQELIKNKYDNISNGRINLVHIFMKKSMEIINDDGIIAYLLPSSILTSPTYKKIREYIFNNFKVEHLIEDVSFKGVAIKVCLLILRKSKSNGEYFYISGDNYFIMSNYKKFSNLKTIEEFGFKVSIGEIVWNQQKELLTDDSNQNILFYSSNLKEDRYELMADKNKEKKQYIKNQNIKYRNCIVFPRTISKNLKYYFVKNNTKLIFENHLLVLTHDDINMLDKFYTSLKSGIYEELLTSFFNSSNLTKSELLSLPFIE